MNWISAYLLKKNAINLTNKLLNKISLCSKVKRSNYKLVGNFLINIEISKNHSDKQVYLGSTFENMEKGFEIFKQLEKNKNKIQSQYLGYSGLSTTDFEISLLIDSYITGIEIWMATVSINFNPENKKNVEEIWRLLNSSDYHKSDTIEYFQKILSMQNYYPKYMSSRVFLEESYRLNPLEYSQAQVSSESRKNIKSPNDDNNINNILNEMELEILPILRNYKNNNFKQKSEVENWAQNKGLSFLENPYEKQIFDLSFKDGKLKEKIIFRIDLNINQLINFQLHFIFYDEFYGLSGVVSPNSDIFLNLDEIQIKYSTGKNYARELFYKFLKQEDIKDINQIFKN